jgi:hypothetical protein
MRLRAFKALIVALLFAAACPPPQVMNALIADGPKQHSAESRKPLQARGRNRIGTPIQTDICQSLSPLASGEKPLRGPSRFFHHQPESTHYRLGFGRFSRPIIGLLRLRC